MWGISSILYLWEIYIPDILAICFYSGTFLGLFGPEDGGDMFLRNVGWLSTDYMALYPRR
jgi:hypothetical protein